MKEKIRKVAGQEMYSEMYKPITEGIESQKETLSSQLKNQLKALPGIQDQLALIPKRFVEKLREVESAKVFEEDLPVTLPDPLSPMHYTEEDFDKILEDYENELGTRPKEVNLDRDIDKEVLSNYSYPEVSVLVMKDKNEWEEVRKKITNDLRSITRNINKYKEKKPSQIINFTDVLSMTAGEYIKELESLNIDVASEFILVAATLMRIKAKMLIPRKELDELGNEIDPREELTQRLLEYKKYKDNKM